MTNLIIRNPLSFEFTTTLTLSYLLIDLPEFLQWYVETHPLEQNLEELKLLLKQGLEGSVCVCVCVWGGGGFGGGVHDAALFYPYRSVLMWTGTDMFCGKNI